MGVTLDVTVCFSLATLKIVYLSFFPLNYMSCYGFLGGSSSGFSLLPVHGYLFPFFRFRKFSITISPNTFHAPFFSSSATPIMQILICLMLVQRSLKLSSLFKICFSFCCSYWVIFTILSSRLLMGSVSPNLPLLCFVIFFHFRYKASLVTETVKNMPAMRETWIQSLSWEDPLEKGMATHSSVLAW